MSHGVRRPATATAVWLACLLAGAGCTRQVRTVGEQGVCREPRERAGTKPTHVEWLRLVLRGYGDRATHECTGEPIKWEPRRRDCIVNSPPLSAPTVRPLAEDSVVVRMLPNDQALVWVITHEFANGDGFGPVALVSMHHNRLVVEAIGPLRMRTERVNLEAWHIGGGTVLAASGETCHDPDVPASCYRATYAMARRGNEWISPDITYPDGTCLDSPWVELLREADKPRPSGWNRHFEIRASVSHDTRYLVITEQVVVSDSDPNAPDVPPRVVRRIDTQRFIHLTDDGRLVTRQHPLWPRILPSAGEVELRD